MKAPFPYFGGKSFIAWRIWELLGNPGNYVEPFAGSAAVLLARPHAPSIETINDKSGFVSNFWRAIHAEPDTVAQWADFPVNENDLHARHAWMVGRKESLQACLEGDPDYYDAKIAGWWVWGMACWIGREFCSGKGPWQVRDGQLVHLGNAGLGVQRKLVHLGSSGRDDNGLFAWFDALSERPRRVRVCCGDWARVCGPTVTWLHGLTGIYFDPPYSAAADRDPDIYQVDDLEVAHAVRDWCATHGGHPLLRIVLSGYSTEHDALLTHGWYKESWTTKGGYGLQGNGKGRANREREMLWISPHCLQKHPAQGVLPFFDPAINVMEE